MSITSGQLSVGTTAIEISGHSVNHIKTTVRSHEHGAGKKIWVGNSTVTPLTGMLLGDQAITFLLNPMEHLHAVTDSGTALLGFVRQG